MASPASEAKRPFGERFSQFILRPKEADPAHKTRAIILSLLVKCFTLGIVIGVARAREGISRRVAQWDALHPYAKNTHGLVTKLFDASSRQEDVAYAFNQATQETASQMTLSTAKKALKELERFFKFTPEERQRLPLDVKEGIKKLLSCVNKYPALQQNFCKLYQEAVESDQQCLKEAFQTLPGEVQLNLADALPEGICKEGFEAQLALQIGLASQDSKKEQKLVTAVATCLYNKKIAQINQLFHLTKEAHSFWQGVIKGQSAILACLQGSTDLDPELFTLFLSAFIAGDPRDAEAASRNIAQLKEAGWRPLQNRYLEDLLKSGAQNPEKVAEVLKEFSAELFIQKLEENPEWLKPLPPPLQQVVAKKLAEGEGGFDRVETLLTVGGVAPEVKVELLIYWLEKKGDQGFFQGQLNDLPQEQRIQLLVGAIKCKSSEVEYLLGQVGTPQDPYQLIKRCLKEEVLWTDPRCAVFLRELVTQCPPSRWDDTPPSRWIFDQLQVDPTWLKRCSPALQRQLALKVSGQLDRGQSRQWSYLLQELASLPLSIKVWEAIDPPALTSAAHIWVRRYLELTQGKVTRPQALRCFAYLPVSSLLALEHSERAGELFRKNPPQINKESDPLKQGTLLLNALSVDFKMKCTPEAGREMRDAWEMVSIDALDCWEPEVWQQFHTVSGEESDRTGTLARPYAERSLSGDSTIVDFNNASGAQLKQLYAQLKTPAERGAVAENIVHALLAREIFISPDSLEAFRLWSQEAPQVFANSLKAMEENHRAQSLYFWYRPAFDALQEEAVPPFSTELLKLCSTETLWPLLLTTTMPNSQGFHWVFDVLKDRNAFAECPPTYLVACLERGVLGSHLDDGLRGRFEEVMGRDDVLQMFCQKPIVSFDERALLVINFLAFPLMQERLPRLLLASLRAISTVEKHQQLQKALEQYPLQETLTPWLAAHPETAIRVFSFDFLQACGCRFEEEIAMPQEDFSSLDRTLELALLATNCRRLQQDHLDGWLTPILDKMLQEPHGLHFFKWISAVSSLVGEEEQVFWEGYFLNKWEKAHLPLEWTKSAIKELQAGWRQPVNQGILLSLMPQLIQSPDTRAWIRDNQVIFVERIFKKFLDDDEWWQRFSSSGAFDLLTLFEGCSEVIREKIPLLTLCELPLGDAKDHQWRQGDLEWAASRLVVALQPALNFEALAAGETEESQQAQTLCAHSGLFQWVQRYEAQFQSLQERLGRMPAYHPLKVLLFVKTPFISAMSGSLQWNHPVSQAEFMGKKEPDLYDQLHQGHKKEERDFSLLVIYAPPEATELRAALARRGQQLGAIVNNEEELPERRRLLEMISMRLADLYRASQEDASLKPRLEEYLGRLVALQESAAGQLEFPDRSGGESPFYFPLTPLYAPLSPLYARLLPYFEKIDWSDPDNRKDHESGAQISKERIFKGLQSFVACMECHLPITGMTDAANPDSPAAHQFFRGLYHGVNILVDDYEKMFTTLVDEEKQKKEEEWAFRLREFALCGLLHCGGRYVQEVTQAAQAISSKKEAFSLKTWVLDLLAGMRQNIFEEAVARAGIAEVHARNSCFKAFEKEFGLAHLESGDAPLSSGYPLYARLKEDFNARFTPAAAAVRLHDEVKRDALLWDAMVEWAQGNLLRELWAGKVSPVMVWKDVLEGIENPFQVLCGEYEPLKQRAIDQRILFNWRARQPDEGEKGLKLNRLFRYCAPAILLRAVREPTAEHFGEVQAQMTAGLRGSLERYRPQLLALTEWLKNQPEGDRAQWVELLVRSQPEEVQKDTWAKEQSGCSSLPITSLNLLSEDVKEDWAVMMLGANWELDPAIVTTGWEDAWGEIQSWLIERDAFERDYRQARGRALDAVLSDEDRLLLERLMDPDSEALFEGGYETVVNEWLGTHSEFTDQRERLVEAFQSRQIDHLTDEVDLAVVKAWQTKEFLPEESARRLWQVVADNREQEIYERGEEWEKDAVAKLRQQIDLARAPFRELTDQIEEKRGELEGIRRNVLRGGAKTLLAINAHKKKKETLQAFLTHLRTVAPMWREAVVQKKVTSGWEEIIQQEGRVHRVKKAAQEEGVPLAEASIRRELAGGEGAEEGLQELFRLSFERVKKEEALQQFTFLLSSSDPATEKTRRAFPLSWVYAWLQDRANLIVES